MARRTAGKSRTGDRAETRLRDVLVLHPAFHPLAVLRLRLCVRRLPGELALRRLRERRGRFCRTLSRHARSRRHQASLRTAGAVRARCPRSGILAARLGGYWADDRGAGKARLINDLWAVKRPLNLTYLHVIQIVIRGGLP